MNDEAFALFQLLLEILHNKISKKKKKTSLRVVFCCPFFFPSEKRIVLVSWSGIGAAIVFLLHPCKDAPALPAVGKPKVRVSFGIYSHAQTPVG